MSLVTQTTNTLNIQRTILKLFIYSLLLEAGAPVEEDHFPNCLSPVAMCSLYGYVSILRQLLSLQKNSSAITKLVNNSNVESEWSPIMLAAAAGSKPTVQCLLERGADPNSHNRLIQESEVSP